MTDLVTEPIVLDDDPVAEEAAQLPAAEERPRVVRRGRSSKAPASLYGAWVKAWGELGTAVKNRLNPFTKGKYADLASVMATVRPVLAKNGLALRHETEMHGSYLFLDTIIFDAQGNEWRAGQLPVADIHSNPQAVGAALTYAKRFHLNAFLCLAADDDDDGNQSAKAHTARAQGSAPAPASDALLRRAREAAGSGATAYRAYFESLANDARRELIDSGEHERLKRELEGGANGGR